MKQWKIVADSISDIRSFEDLPSSVEYEYVPLMINIDDKTYIDNDDLDLIAFQEALDKASKGSTTACSSPETYAQAFSGAENVVCFTVSGALSGSYNSAMLGAEIARENNPNVNIHVFDTKTACAEINLSVRKAIELAKKGIDFNTMITEMKNYGQSTNVNFILQSVRNLVNNGRVSRLVGSMVGLLNIFLIGERTPEGTISLAHRARGIRRAIKTLMREIKNNGYAGGAMEISHSFNEEDVDSISKEIYKEFPSAKITITPMSGLCMFYAEKKGIIIGFETDKK